MKGLSILALVLSFIVIFTSCSKKTKEYTVKERKSVNKIENKKTELKKEKENISESNENLAFAKGEIILQDGVLKKILSKLDVYMSSLPKQQVEFIKSLKLEEFKGLYWVMNNEKFYVKINGLDISKVIELVNKKTPEKNPKYKELKAFKYFIENKTLYATNSKDSFMSSENIGIEKIISNYNMVITDNLKSLIKESKNNGFYFALYGKKFFRQVINSLPPFVRSLKGVSLFSYENNGTKLKLLAKLNNEDAKLSAENFKKMYQVYLPMIITQVNNFEKMLLEKEDIGTSEKEAYKKVVLEFKEMMKSLEIKASNDNLFFTINIKSLETTIIIAGVLSAIALPSYLKYVKESKK